MAVIKGHMAVVKTTTPIVVIKGPMAVVNYFNSYGSDKGSHGSS